MKSHQHQVKNTTFRAIIFHLILGGLMLVVAPSSWSQVNNVKHQASASRHDHSSKKTRFKKPKKQPKTASQPSEQNENSTPTKILHSHQLSALDEKLGAAYFAFQQADFVSARQHYRQALTLDSNSRDAMLGLAVVAQHEKQDASALHYFQAAWRLDPTDPVANAGLALYTRSDVDGTESRLKQLLMQTPCASLYFALGNHYAVQSRWADARFAYDHALSLEPNNALINLGVAVSLDHLQQTVLAQRHYQLAMQLDVTPNGSFDHTQIQQRLSQLAE